MAMRIGLLESTVVTKRKSSRVSRSSPYHVDALCQSCSLPLHCRLPFLRGFAPVAFAQRREQLRADRDRPRFVADQLGHALRRGWATDVVAHGVEVAPAGDDVLAALREQIVEEEPRGVRPFRLG